MDRFQAALEKTVGVAVMRTEEILRKRVALRDNSKQRMQAQRAPEDGLVVDHAPASQFLVNRLGRVFHQQDREALPLEAGLAEFLVAVHDLHALVKPPREVFAQIEEHADLAEAAFQQPSAQLVVGKSFSRKESLKNEAGARAEGQPVWRGGVREGVQDERRKSPVPSGHIDRPLHVH
jgi:hypothetical protein